MWNLLDEVQSKSKSFIQKCSQVQCISWLSEAQGVLSRLRMNFLWLISFIYWWSIIIWLVVSTPLKNISQIGSSSPNRGENKKSLKPPSSYPMKMHPSLSPNSLHTPSRPEWEKLQAARAMALRDRFPASWTGSCISRNPRNQRYTTLGGFKTGIHLHISYDVYDVYVLLEKNSTHGCG